MSSVEQTVNIVSAAFPGYYSARQGFAGKKTALNRSEAGEALDPKAEGEA